MGTQQQNGNNNNSSQGKSNNNSNNNNSNDQNGSTTTSSKPVFERGASWSFGETKLLLALWSQDMVQRQLTNSKRTKHVWEKIAERIREHGYDRSAEQVRTRVFNMMAEYRRILKNPTPERRKKCIFFDALHKIYQAKDSNNLENVIMAYNGGSGGSSIGDGENYNFDPLDFTSEETTEMNGTADENSDNDDLMVYSLSPDGVSNYIGNMNDLNDDSMLGLNDDTFPPAKRGRYDDSMVANADLSINNNNNNNANNVHYQSYLDQSALLLDRTFRLLSQDREIMRVWFSLERDRLTQETIRRKEETEREERREKNFMDQIIKFQENVFSLLKQNNSCQHSANPSSSCSNIAKIKTVNDEQPPLNGNN